MLLRSATQRNRRPAGVTASIVLAATATATISAFQPTFDFTTETPAPFTVVTVPCVAASTPVFSLIGLAAAGFDVVNDGGSARIRLFSRDRMREAGARYGLLKTRVFTLRAVLGGETAECTVTVTLSTAGMPFPVAGLDFAIGRTSTAALKDPLVTPPVGWTLDTVKRHITQNADNAILEDYDLRGWRPINTGKVGGIIRQCIMGSTVGQPIDPPTVSQIYYMDSRKTATPLIVEDNAFIFDAPGSDHRWNGASTAFTAFRRNVVIGAPNDGLNISDCPDVSHNFVSTGNRNIRDAAGLPRTDVLAWGHSDPLQCYALTGPVLVNGGDLLCTPVPWREGAAIRQPAGTVAVTANSDVFVGTGTFWLTGGANDRIDVGQVVRPQLGASGVVMEVISDTQLRIGNGYSGPTASGRILRVFAFEDARSGVTSSTFLQGVSGLGSPHLHLLEARNLVATGGSYIAQSGSFAGYGGETNAIIGWYNCAFGDWAFAPVATGATNMATTGTVQGCFNLYTLAPIPDLRPFPLARPLTQGATTQTSIAVSFASQDASIVYEWQVAPAGSGAWSTLADVPGDFVRTGLSPGTAYDFRMRGKNCLATNGTYLQVGPWATATFSTAAAPPPGDTRITDSLDTRITDSGDIRVIDGA